MKKKIILSTILATSLFAGSIKFNEADSNFERVNPGYAPNVVLSYHSSIDNAKKSVVNISTTKIIKNYSSPLDDMFNNPFFKDFFGGFNLGRRQKRGSTQKSKALGSGVIISSDGYIVTNNHVIDGADEIIVSLLDNEKEYKAKLIGADPKTDLAIIKIDAKDLKAIPIADSSKSKEGDIVFAIGNPFGVGGTITQGIISALNKNNIGLNQYENFIQTDASINPGNSGGALVDSRGALVGINSAILSRGGGNNGVGFAIPSNMVKDIAQKLITTGKIERGYIGAMLANLNEDQKDVYKNKEGSLIAEVEKGKPAEKAGIKRGDLVIEANGKPIKNAGDLKNLVGSLAPNSNIHLKVERNKEIKEFDVKLASLENSVSNSSKDELDGMMLRTLTDSLKEKYGIDKDISGVLITEIKDDSKALDWGFREGDVIMQVGQVDIKSIKDLEKALKEYKNQKTLIWVLRDKIPQGIVIKNK